MAATSPLTLTRATALEAGATSHSLRVMEGLAQDLREELTFLREMAMGQTGEM